MWWKQAVFYEVYVRSFSDSDGDGVGDLRGVVDRLDYLADTLGVDALWLSPFYPSPQKDYSYDVADHMGVDPLFGDLETFDELLRGAQGRGLKLLVDYVPNHTSDRHAWFVESRSSRDSDRRDWYMWADPSPDGSPPNNWLSVFGGPAWTFDDATGQYYMHSFLAEMPELNWRNPSVEQAMFDVVRFWMERGVDGIRIDCAHYLMKDPQMRDNPLNPEMKRLAHRPLGQYDSQIHLYDKGHEDNHPVYRRLRKLLDTYHPPRTAIGEIHIYDWSEWARYFGHGDDELNMNFNFGLLGVEWDAAAVRGLVEEVYSVIPEGAWPNWAIGNHDEPRVASRLGADRARQALMLMLTLRGSPTLYYGDELGMPNAPLSPAGTMDPWGLQDPTLSRDPQRAPMPWSREPNAGFCPAEARPWAPLAAAAKDLSVAAQLEDPGSFLCLTRRLLAVRKLSLPLRTGTYQTIEAPEGCYAFAREAGGKRCLVVLNFSAQQCRFPLPDDARRLMASTKGNRCDPEPGAITLAALEGCIFGP
jgi:alpha-glucosidase